LPLPLPLPPPRTRDCSRSRSSLSIRSIRSASRSSLAFCSPRVVAGFSFGARQLPPPLRRCTQRHSENNRARPIRTAAKIAAVIQKDMRGADVAAAVFFFFFVCFRFVFLEIRPCSVDFFFFFFFFFSFLSSLSLKKKVMRLVWVAFFECKGFDNCFAIEWMIVGVFFLSSHLFLSRSLLFLGFEIAEKPGAH
jgi:hypothetical protein